MSKQRNAVRDRHTNAQWKGDGVIPSFRKDGKVFPLFWGYAIQTERGDRITPGTFVKSAIRREFTHTPSSAILFDSEQDAIEALDAMRIVSHGSGIFEDDGDFPKIVYVQRFANICDVRRSVSSRR